MKQDEPKYDQIVELMKEVRDEIIGMAPQSWKQEITEAIDLDILSQVVKQTTCTIVVPKINIYFRECPYMVDCKAQIYIFLFFVSC